MTPTYKRYALGLMTAVFTLNLVDRALMNLLLEPIKIDLDLSDSQLGFVTGIAFALFYATAGLPLARWADRGDRSTIAAAAIGLWGMTVMSCLWVGNFIQLALARIAAAIGEAGCKPPTYSLVGDYFPQPVERTRAMTVYMLGGPLAALIAFIAGGWLNEHFGWRATFFIMGVPGLVLAVLVRATLIEPRRSVLHRQAAGPVLPSWKCVLLLLWRQRSSRHLFIGLVLFYMLGFGMGPWYAAFMMRTHGMGTAELGLALGLIHGVGGVSGILLGGYVASRWFAGNEPGQMRVTSIAVALLVPLMAAFLFLPHKHYALFMLVPQQIALYFLHAPIFTLLQRLVPDSMRATALAVVMLLAHLVGMGIGPQIVGVLSDLLRSLTGSDALHYAMLVACLVALCSSYHFWQVGRTVGEDLAAVGQSL